MSEFFCNHRIALCNGRYTLAIRSFPHANKQLYQATILEEGHINYQTQGYDGKRVFRSIRAVMDMFGVMDEASER